MPGNPSLRFEHNVFIIQSFKLKKVAKSRKQFWFASQNDRKIPFFIFFQMRSNSKLYSRLSQLYWKFYFILLILVILKLAKCPTRVNNFKSRSVHVAKFFSKVKRNNVFDFISPIFHHVSLYETWLNTLTLELRIFSMQKLENHKFL